MDKRVRTTYDIIRRDFRQSLDLTALAERVGLSPFHFHRLFKQELGTTPRMLLNQTRLDRAAHLLVLNSYHSLSEVAMDCGFSSLSSFSRAFSAHFKVAPRKFLSSIELYKPERAYDVSKLHIDVRYVPGYQVIYSLSTMGDDAICRAFEQTSAYCSYEGLEAITGRQLGIMTHNIHKKGLCYYAGLELSKPLFGKRYQEKLFEIPEGYYASFYLTISSAELWDFVICWKEQWLDPSPYAIAEPMAFEIVESQTGTSTDGLLTRHIHIPVKRKTARIGK